MNEQKIILMGNPNVGKSTLFNKLTGKRQHTGNWAGKTVETATGVYKTKDKRYRIVDLPGIYSLNYNSPEEKIAKDYLINEQYDAVLIICDATDLYRNLKLALEVIKICPKSILCINMLDEAKRRGITVDLKGLSKALCIPVIGGVFKRNADEVKEAIKLIEKLDNASPVLPYRDELIKNYVKYGENKLYKRDKKIDKILCGKYTRYPVMLFFLLIILWITVMGANYPSQLLSRAFAFLGNKLNLFAAYINMPFYLKGILIDGAYNVLSLVVSVMLPPMAIFFPLFALLEESGILPRIAYNLDPALKKCGGTGKQALTMCMGLGCNAVGVMNSRIIPSKKRRLIAILTNSLIPCNGRFPTVILLISVMLGSAYTHLYGAMLLTLFIVVSIILTLIITFILSISFKDEEIAPVIELPCYKRPDVIKTLIDTFINKTVKGLTRAIVVAAPAGALLWLINTLSINGRSVLLLITEFLNPVGRFLCMDGVILTAFILGFPANETVLPVAVMIYSGAATLAETDNGRIISLLLSNGWSGITCLSVILFSLFHWPCATTLLTINKETKSIKYTLLAVLIPTATGIVLCSLLNLVKLI